jgi:hypothetical protein
VVLACANCVDRQGEVIDKHVDKKHNPDGTTTETTVWTVREGNVTKKITEVKTS